MCGIVGIICKNNLNKKLLDNLSKLEYRGYDSAGIGYIENGKIVTVKSEGKILNLKRKIKNKNDNFSCGIAHTRWATHGKPTEANCHPHLSNDKQWGVVHNGIIENYQPLKKKLEKQGIKFNSQTDTEVIANLIATNNGQKNIYSVIEACNCLKGSYALCIINASSNDEMYVAKMGTPLYIVQSKNLTIVSSDTVCFSGQFREYYSLNDGEFAKIKKDCIAFYDSNKNVIQKDKVLLEKSFSNVTKKCYPHFMLKEIKEIPDLLPNVYDYYTKNQDLCDHFNDIVVQSDNIYFVACGTAYHSGLVGEYYFKKSYKKNIQTFIASEFMYSDVLFSKNTLCIFISQSGETADTISSCIYAKNMGCKAIVLTNNLNSTITKYSDLVLPVLAGREIAVASTKAYNCQCLVLQLLSLCNKCKLKYDLEKLCDFYNTLNEDKIKKLACTIIKNKQVFFIGRGIDYISCMEASLKLKEISYINSSAYPSGELKHGTLSLVDNKSFVICLITQKQIKDKAVNAVFEVKARGGKVVILSPFDDCKKICGDDDFFIKLPDIPYFSVQTVIVPMQYLAYFSAVECGLDPDKPRNLAKSVTVE